MTSEKPRSPLLMEEDWWTVWFGLAILLVATVLGMQTLSGSISAKKVPKIGAWVSNPADALYQSRKTSIDIPEGTTLAGAAERINTAGAGASAEIVSEGGGVRLQIASTREGVGKTISLSALLAGGSTQLKFSEIDPDPAGIGAKSYSSQTLDSPDVNIGSGKLTVTAQRTSSIVLPLIVTIFFIMLLTAIGVRVMGQNSAKYAEAFAVIFLLAILSFVVANQTTIKAYGFSYAAWALLLWLVISNTIGTPEWLTPAVRTEMYI